MEWVEVKGPSIEVAVAAALEELGLSNAEEADVEVLQEPEKGFLGVGRREAVVRVKTKPKQQQRRRRRGRGGRGGSQREDRPAGAQTKEPRSKAGPKQRRENSTRSPRNDQNGEKMTEETRPSTSPEEREEIIADFLRGVVEAFGLEGTVETRTDDDVLYVDVVGDQTEALVGQKGAVMQALHELARTVVQRKTQSGVRLRLDVAGYAARRREALGIYAHRLVDQLREEGGGEVMLEPMNPADRKVIHDAVAELDGVASFSEGEEPKRSVVISVPGSDD